MAVCLAAGLLGMVAFASGSGATPNANKGSGVAQAVNCRGDVVLDPGHGGTDPGATNGALKEKDQTLNVAYKLRELLKGAGYTVCMTRGGDPTGTGDDNAADDATLSNSERYTFANTTGARVLVSIHMNGSTNPATDYTTTLFGKWQKDKALALDLYDGLRLNLPAASDSSLYIRGRTPYSYASGVLLKSNMPATIAETVFITNNDEARLLAAGTR